MLAEEFYMKLIIINKIQLLSPRAEKLIVFKATQQILIQIRLMLGAEGSKVCFVCELPNIVFLLVKKKII